MIATKKNYHDNLAQMLTISCGSCATEQSSKIIFTVLISKIVTKCNMFQRLLKSPYYILLLTKLSQFDDKSGVLCVNYCNSGPVQKVLQFCDLCPKTDTS